MDYFITDKDFNDFKVSFINLIEDYIVDIKNGIYYDITNITSVLASIVLHQKNKAHCNAGISYITLSADGKFYRCPRFVGQKEFCMGDVYSINILEENIKEHKRNLGKSAVNRNVNCSNCSYVYLCGGVCYHHSYTRNLSEYQNVTSECIQNKLIFEKTIELICRLNVNERSQFLLFLINIWNIYGKEKNL